MGFHTARGGKIKTRRLSAEFLLNKAKIERLKDRYYSQYRLVYKIMPLQLVLGARATLEKITA